MHRGFCEIETPMVVYVFQQNPYVYVFYGL